MLLLHYFHSAYVSVRVIQVLCRGKKLSLSDSVTSTIEIRHICKADDCGVQRRTPNEDNAENAANFMVCGVLPSVY